MNDLPIDWETLAIADEIYEHYEQWKRKRTITKELLQVHLARISGDLCKLAELTTVSFPGEDDQALLSNLWDAVHYADSALNRLNDELLTY